VHTIGSYTHGPYSPTVGALLPVVVAILLVARRLVQRKSSAAGPRWYKVSLCACLVVAIGNYFAFGEFRYDSYMNEWDVTHYYTGTKYATELGYDRQYEAIWLADHDTGLRSTATAVRSLRTYDMVPTAGVIAHAADIRGHFSPERWREFCEDIAWLKIQLPASRWTLLTEDHGNNAPPTWTAAVGAITNFHGTAIFSDWMAKMVLHATSHESWTVGFRTLFNTVNEPSFSQHSAVAVARWVDTRLATQDVLLLWFARIAVLLPALYFMRFMTAASAYGFAYVVMFFLVAPVHYYSMVLCLPLLYFVAEQASWSRTLGIAWLLLTGSLGYLLYFGWQPLHAIWLFRGHGLTFANTLTMTCFMMLTTLHMIAHSARVAMVEQDKHSPAY
jgi:hypothetical protein